MTMLVKDNKDRFLKIEDIDVVFTDNKNEASNFSSMSVEDFSVLKEHLEDAHDIELETIFE